jgi:hypothetical protein
MSLRYGRRAGERGRGHAAGHNEARLPGLRVEFAPLARERPDTHPGAQPLARWGIALLDEQNLQFELMWEMVERWKFAASTFQSQVMTLGWVLPYRGYPRFQQGSLTSVAQIAQIEYISAAGRDRLFSSESNLPPVETNSRRAAGPGSRPLQRYATH